MATIIAQIEDVEKQIQRREKELDEIERQCRLVEMSDVKRQELTSEKKLLEKQIKKYRTELRGLRWQNWKSMLISVCLFGLLYIIYLLFFES